MSERPANTGWERPPTLRLASFGATSLGGLLVGLGALLNWGAVTVQVPGATGSALTSNVPGVDLAEGMIALILGFALLVIGVVMRGIRAGRTARILGWVIVAASILATGIAVLDIVRKDSAFNSGAQETAHKIANTTGLPYADLLSRIQRFLVVDLKLGIYLVLIGGIIGLIGGLLGLAWISGRDRRAARGVTDAPLSPDAPPPLPPPDASPPEPGTGLPADPSGSQLPPD